MKISQLKLFLSHGSKLRDTQFESLSWISIMLRKHFEIVHEDYFSVSVFDWGPVNIKFLFPKSKLIFNLCFLSRKERRKQNNSGQEPD